MISRFRSCLVSSILYGVSFFGSVDLPLRSLLDSAFEYKLYYQGALAMLSERMDSFC